MENISKALIIVGGVLIALIILSTFLVMYNNVSKISNQKEEKIKRSQLLEFNSQYEAYNKKLMYGTDVITLCNKINNNNSSGTNSNITLYYEGKIINKIIVTKEEKEEAGTKKIIEYGEVYNGNTMIDKKEDFIKLRFKCTGIEYNDKDGKVCKISIERVNDNA